MKLNWSKIFFFNFYKIILHISNSKKVHFQPKKVLLKKALIFGSLILISVDNFKTFSCGTVLDSDNASKTRLTKGYQWNSLSLLLHSVEKHKIKSSKKRTKLKFFRLLSALTSKKGEITVAIEDGKMPTQALPYTMIESAAFFEPYKHVLRQIQTKAFLNMPFKEYLVGEDNYGDRVLQKMPKVPRYLRNQVSYL